MNDLVKYDAACRAVSEAASIDEAKEFRDQSEAMRAYARQAKNKQLEVQAAEIRIRAERRIGELMVAQREAGHMATAGRPSQEIGSKTNPISKAPTLAEVGIDKKLADRARKYAAIPEQEFNGIVSDWRDKVEAENERVTLNLLDAGQRAEMSITPTGLEAQPEPVAARDPYGYRKLTYEALADTADGLREGFEEERSRRKKAEAEAKELKRELKEMSESKDLGPVVSNLRKQLGALKLSRDDALTAAKRMEYRMKKAEARAKELENLGVAY